MRTKLTLLSYFSLQVGLGQEVLFENSPIADKYLKHVICIGTYIGEHSEPLWENNE